MKRLENSRLIFGSLLRVEAPHLVERYNKALIAFGLPPTEMRSFRIDMTGYSPEVSIAASSSSPPSRRSCRSFIRSFRIRRG